MRVNVDNNEVKRLYQKGFSTVDIARRFHCGRSTINYRLRQVNYPLRPPIAARKLKAPWNRKSIDTELLKHLYVDEEFSQDMLAGKFGVARIAIRYRLRELGLSRSRGEAHKIAGKRGRIQPKRGWHYTDNQGYVHVRQVGHPKAYNNYIYEHLLVWEQHHEQSLPKGWHIHHLNGIKNDNRPSNLVAMPPAKHRIKHATLLDERAKRIRELEIENRQLRRALEDNQAIFYLNEN